LFVFLVGGLANHYGIDSYKRSVYDRRAMAQLGRTRSRSVFAICVFRRSAVLNVVPTGTHSYNVPCGKCRILVGTEMLLLGSVIARPARRNLHRRRMDLFHRRRRTSAVDDWCHSSQGGWLPKKQQTFFHPDCYVGSFTASTHSFCSTTSMYTGSGF
jgi:hypothetical protein